ncbi:MAG: response regulator transcription factor [Flavobacteriales bacterium]|nr:response regulator transcription factor [Flavobacteriales bacterium]
MRVLIVDDELRAQRSLENLLDAYCPRVSVVASVGSVAAAVGEINRHQPDLVFLDIEMPHENGFALFKWMPNPTFRTIFTTAYEQYAINAFRVSAVDYLLKPIQAEQLVQAVDRASELDKKLEVWKIQHLRENMEKREIKKVSFPTSNGLRFVPPQEIVLLKSEGSYTHVWLQNDQKMLISRKLGELEFVSLLPYFCRTHRSFVVNLHHVVEYVRSDGGYLLLSNGEMASISRDKKDEVIALLG